MSGVNKVILIGRLGKDPELRKTNSGSSVCSFSLATSEKFTDKQGQQQEQTEWHNVVAWNKQAETMSQYLQKGSSVYIEGKLKTQSWEDNGAKKYRTEVLVQSFQFLDSKQQGGQQQPQQGFPQQQNNGFGQPQQQSQGGFPQQQGFPQQPPAGLPMQDELPF